MDLKALQTKGVDKIREDLDELTREQLIELRAIETETNDPPRVTLIKAIDGKLEELAAAAPDAESNTQAKPESNGADDLVEDGAPHVGDESTGEAPASSQDTPPPATPNGAEDAAAAPAVEAPAAPAWQAPDYCGPMTGDQALWRVANLKAR